MHIILCSVCCMFTFTLMLVSRGDGLGVMDQSDGYSDQQIYQTSIPSYGSSEGHHLRDPVYSTENLTARISFITAESVHKMPSIFKNVRKWLI